MSNREKQQGRESQAVILFADIVGCSQVSDALSLCDYAEFVGSFHEIATTAVQAVFGPPLYQYPSGYELSIRGDEVCLIVHENANEDIRRAMVFAVALQVLWLTSNYNRERLAKGCLPVELGIGIHAGRVYITHLQDSNPAAQGYAINVGKRIEGLTRKGVASRILISSQAFDQIATEHRGHTFRMQVCPPTTIRGVSGTFALSELVEIDESSVIDLPLPRDRFDEALIAQVAFVMRTRTETSWLRTLHDICFGILKGKEALFRDHFRVRQRAHWNSHMWVAQGNRELSNGDANMAIMMYDMAVSTATDSGARAWAYYLSGLANERRGLTSVAVLSYQAAVINHVTNTQYRIGLVAAYLKDRRPEEARSFLSEFQDDVLEPSWRAAVMFMEAICCDALNDPVAAAACRRSLQGEFHVDIAHLPEAGHVLALGVNTGDLVIKQFANIHRPPADTVTVLQTPQTTATARPENVQPTSAKKLPLRRAARSRQRRKSTRSR